MSQLEDKLKRAQEEKASLQADVASVRELCVKLDSDKELTVRQLTSRSMDLERVSSALTDRQVDSFHKAKYPVKNVSSIVFYFA